MEWVNLKINRLKLPGVILKEEYVVGLNIKAASKTVVSTSCTRKK